MEANPSVDLLLERVAEEATEIAHRALKALRFGLKSEYEGLNNLEHIAVEVAHLNAVLSVVGVVLPNEYSNDMEFNDSGMWLKVGAVDVAEVAHFRASELMNELERRCQS